MKIYIISLERDVEKRSVISKKLDSLNLDYYFVDAILGKRLSKDYIDKLELAGKVIKRNYKPTPGEVGCTLSHIKAINIMIESGDDWCCILEDDAILDGRFKKFINEFYESDHAKSTLYILGGQEGLFPEKFISKSLLNTKLIGEQKFSKIVKSEKYVNRTCCYVISKEFARKYKKFSCSRFFLADDWDLLKNNHIFSDMYLSNFVCHPIDLSQSSIENERKEYTSKGEKGIKVTKLYGLVKIGYFFVKKLNAYIYRFLG